MRPIALLLVAACGAATPPPKAGQLAAPTCVIRGGKTADVRPRVHGKPIAIFDEYGFDRVTLRATARAAMIEMTNAAYTYFGEAALADAHVTLKAPQELGWLRVTDARIARVDGDVALLAIDDPAIRYETPITITATCRDLALGTTVRPVELMALAPNQTFALFDAPNGARVATITLGEPDDCGGGRLEARVLEESGASFRRLHIPTRFGALEAWTDSARVVPGEGQRFCGTTSGPGAYVLDSARVCPRDVPIYVRDGGATVQVGVVHPGTDINVVEGSRGEGVLVAAGTTRAPLDPSGATSTPFVRFDDIERCPTRGRLGR